MLRPLLNWESYKIRKPPSSSVMSAYKFDRPSMHRLQDYSGGDVKCAIAFTVSVAFTATVISVPLMCGVLIHSEYFLVKLVVLS